MLDKLVICGSPGKVAEDLLAFREEVGDFGTLLYAGKDWLDRDLGRRSMVLMAEQVLPAINAVVLGRRSDRRHSHGLGRVATVRQQYPWDRFDAAKHCVDPAQCLRSKLPERSCVRWRLQLAFPCAKMSHKFQSLCLRLTCDG